MTNEQGIAILESQNTPRSFGSFAEDNPNPYAMQWTLDIQHELMPGLVVETGYVGTRALKLSMTHRFNEPDRITNVRPYPASTSTSWVDASDNSIYHAWQTQVHKRFSNDYAMNANYIWSKSMSIAMGDFGGSNNLRVQEETNLRADWAPTNFDRTHVFSLDAVWAPSFDRWLSAGGAWKQVVGGWQFTGTYQAQTGTPLTLNQSNSRELQRPDYAGGEIYLHPEVVTDLYINKAAFLAVPVSPASGITIRPGNVGNRSLRAPNSWLLNFNVLKRFAIRDGIALQFRMEMYNALNHANLGSPNLNISNSLFGRITSTQAGRSIQLGGRLEF